MFMGQYEHSIDAKGRAIVPAKYREELGDLFYVTWGVDGCLYLYPQHDWEELAQKLQSLPSSHQSRMIQRQLMASASEVTLDKDTFEAQTLGSEMSMEEAMDALGISL